MTTFHKAELRRIQIDDWFRGLGFKITVPVSNVANDEIDRRGKAGQALFYRPASSQVSYETFMAASGQDRHWTVTTERDREKVGWEPAAVGYWYWAEVQGVCPRPLTARIKLPTDLATARLLALEEYVIVWHAHHAATNQKLDLRTWSWLRTRFGRFVLGAHECDGVVDIFRGGIRRRSIPRVLGGLRASEVVTNVT